MNNLDVFSAVWATELYPFILAKLLSSDRGAPGEKYGYQKNNEKVPMSERGWFLKSHGEALLTPRLCGRLGAAVEKDVGHSLVDFSFFTNRGFPVFCGGFLQIFNSGIPCVLRKNSLEQGYKDHVY
jgi:hypothetical protein